MTEQAAAVTTPVADEAPALPIATRILRATEHIDITHGRGLEIGPLCRPIVSKAEADVYYADVIDTQALKDHYANDPNVANDEIVDVDFALTADGHVRRIAEAAAPAAPYDWLIASHVIEHVPDLVTFLNDTAELLRDRGRLSLVVPDRRFCFDALRPGTTVGEILLAHRNGDTRPSVRAVFDHFYDAVSYDPSQLWRGIPATPQDRLHTFAQATSMLERYEKTDEYLDSHTWLFTPSSLVAQLGTLARLGLLDYTVAAVSPTEPNDIEFFVTLERVPVGLSAQERADLIAGGFVDVIEHDLVVTESQVSATPPEPPKPAQPSGTAEMVVSEREQKLLLAKRKWLTRIRGILHR